MLLIIIGCVLLFIIAGAILIRYDLPYSIERNTHRKGEAYYSEYGRDTYKKDEIVRGQVIGQQIGNFFFWPLLVPIRIIQNTSNVVMDRVDPQVLQRMKDTNTELERVLRREREESLKELEEFNKRVDDLLNAKKS